MPDPVVSDAEKVLAEVRAEAERVEKLIHELYDDCSAEFSAELIQVKSAIERAFDYAKANAHRIISWAIAEAGTLEILAHNKATTFESQVAVAGAAAIAALVNKLRQEDILP